MSKSAGEFLRLQLLVDRGYHPLAYRLMCLQAHYRSELEFSWDGLGAALTRLKRLVMAASPVRDAAAAAIADRRLTDLLAKFDAAVSADLNTAVALTLVEEAAARKKIDAGTKRAVHETLDAALGLQLLTLSRDALGIRPATASIPTNPNKDHT